MKILITGASGNVGRRLCADLAEKHTIIAIGRAPISGVEGSHVFDIDIIEQPEKVANLFDSEKPEAVVHLASVVGGDCEANPELAEHVNVDGTRQLAALAGGAGVGRFIFFSTAAVYKQTELEPTDELSNVNPQSAYGRTKLQAEEAITEEAKKAPDTEFVSLRPFNIYGPNFKNSLVHRLIHSDIDNPVQLMGFDNFYRDYVHISDISQATRLALEADHFDQPHTILNIASEVPTTNHVLVDFLEDNDVKTNYNVDPTDNLNVSWANITHARKAIGFIPSKTIIIDL